METISWRTIQRLENIALLNAETAIFSARIAGMVAENKQREHLGQTMAYMEDSFQQEISAFPDPISILRRGV